MGGIGFMELLILAGIGLLGLIVLFFVVQAAVRSGNREQ